MFNEQKVKHLMDKFAGTQKDFANECGVAKTTIDSILSKKNPTADTLEKIANYAKAPIDYFFDRNVDIDPQYLPKQKSEKSKEKSPEKSETVKELIAEVKDLTKKNTIQEIEIEQLKKELANKKTGGSSYGNVAEHELDFRKSE